MKQRKQLVLKVADIGPGPRGWTVDSPQARSRMLASVRKFGQLRPVLVRQVGGLWELVDGRRLLDAVRELGGDKVVAIDIGEADPVRVRLALMVAYEVDYAAVAEDVAALVGSGASPADLASCSPFEPDRIAYFPKLLQFDWSMYRDAAGGGQASFDVFDEVEEEAPADQPTPAAAVQAAVAVEVAAATAEVADEPAGEEPGPSGAEAAEPGEELLEPAGGTLF